MAALGTTVGVITKLLSVPLVIWAIVSQMLFSLSSNTTVCHHKLIFQEAEGKRGKLCGWKVKKKTVSSRNHVTGEILLQEMPSAMSFTHFSDDISGN